MSMSTIWSSLQAALVAAESTQSHPQVLTELALHPNTAVKYVLAKNRNAPLAVLERLSQDENPKIRKAVASNKCIPPQIASFLINDRSSLVRTALVKNKVVYCDTLRPLCFDKSISVRIALARRKDTSLDTLRLLIQDVNATNEELLIAAATNPALPKSVTAEFRRLIPWHKTPTEKKKATPLQQVLPGYLSQVKLPVEFVLTIKALNQWLGDVRSATKQEVPVQ